MRVALVHDYLNEFGGAERVLLALSEIWPDAPIYTAFYKDGSPAWERFKDRKVKVSWFHYVPFVHKLASPLRFLAPFIWNSFVRQLADFDVVVTSASWYVTKGFGTRRHPELISGSRDSGLRQNDSSKSKPVEICYCHTPPRYLYGYKTSIDWQKYWLVRVYATIVNHFMRIYDFNAAQRVDYFIVNSKNVAERVKKFYRRDSTVIYPPVEIIGDTKNVTSDTKDYYLVVSRIVGGKGLELAIRAANKLGFKLKVVGTPGGYGRELEKIKKISKDNIEYLGFVEDGDLAELYRNAKGFLALAQDEDFGITPVEAMLAGTPVVAYRGGGYVESVVDPSARSARSGQVATGIFFDEQSVESLVDAIKKFEKSPPAGGWNRREIARYAQRFNKERFKREIKSFVESKYR